MNIKRTDIPTITSELLSKMNFYAKVKTDIEEKIKEVIEQLGDLIQHRDISIKEDPNQPYAPSIESLIKEWMTIKQIRDFIKNHLEEK